MESEHSTRNLDAVMLAEGVTEGTEAEVLKAWQHLIDTGLAWQLQGWFGRRAKALIESGACQPRRSFTMPSPP